MIEDPIAYTTALSEVQRGRFAMCVPGVMDGEPVVSTQSYFLNDESLHWLTARDSDERVLYIIALAREAHEIAQQSGVY
jgi:hypothetical protein